MIDCLPKVVRHPFDLNVDLVQVPAALSARSHRLNPIAADFGNEHRPDPVPPAAHRLVAEVDPRFVQQVLDLAK